MLYRRKRANLIGIFIILVVVILLNFSIFNTTPLLRFSRAVSIRLIYPVQYAANSLYVATRDFFVNIALLRSAQKENKSLQAELSLYKAKVNSFNELVKDNEQLREYLKYRSSSPFSYRLLNAEVIARSASNWFSSFEINRGQDDGIKGDMAVISADGLVGRIAEVSKSSSKVLLITDPSSAVSVVNQRSRHVGIIIGSSIGPLLMKYVSSNADMQPGDIIVTSGMSEVFPRGIAVGTVTSVNKKDYDLFQKISVSPAVNLSKLESVFVVVR